jgi:hypothetical protein
MIISGEKGFALALGLLFMATSQSPDYITRTEKVSPTGNLLKSSHQLSAVSLGRARLQKLNADDGRLLNDSSPV